MLNHHCPVSPGETNWLRKLNNLCKGTQIVRKGARMWTMNWPRTWELNHCLLLPLSNVWKLEKSKFRLNGKMTCLTVGVHPHCDKLPCKGEGSLSQMMLKHRLVAICQRLFTRECSPGKRRNRMATNGTFNSKILYFQNIQFRAKV